MQTQVVNYVDFSSDHYIMNSIKVNMQANKAIIALLASWHHSTCICQQRN